MEVSRRSTHCAVLARPLRATLAVLCCLAALALLGFSGPTAAQTDSPAAPGIDQDLITTLSKRGDLTLRDATLGEALFTIGQTWKINLVVSEDVKGRVNGVFQDAPLHEILDSILLANGYSYRPVGKSLVVMGFDKLGRASHPLLKTVVVPLRHGDPKEVLSAANLLSSPQGKILEISSARSVMIVDFPDRVATITKMIHDLDEAASRVGGTGGGDDRLDVRTFTPSYIPVESLKESLNSVLSPEGKVATLTRENKIVVVDFPSRLKLAADVVKQLDVPLTQIRITAFIYDISLEDMKQLGINWNHALKGRVDGSGNAQSVFSIDSTTALPAAAGAIGSAITFMNLSRSFDITAVVAALEQASDSRLLANPNVTVLNNETAVLEVIKEIPFQQLTQTGNGGNIGTTGFREAGIRLTVTARAAADGTVLLDVEPTFSRVAGIFQSSQGDQPIIDRSRAKTTVRVASGQTMVIGGLRQRTDIGSFNGVPFLKDAWLIGKLFRGKTTAVRESELVVFITPEIIKQPAIDNPRDDRSIGVGRDLLDRIPLARLPYVEPYRDRPIPEVEGPGVPRGRFGDAPPFVPEVIVPSPADSPALSPAEPQGHVIDVAAPHDLPPVDGSRFNGPRFNGPSAEGTSVEPFDARPSATRLTPLPFIRNEADRHGNRKRIDDNDASSDDASSDDDSSTDQGPDLARPPRRHGGAFHRIIRLPPVASTHRDRASFAWPDDFDRRSAAAEPPVHEAEETARRASGPGRPVRLPQVDRANDVSNDVSNDTSNDVSNDTSWINEMFSP